MIKRRSELYKICYVIYGSCSEEFECNFVARESG